jgi:hypothetical protein
MEGPKVALERQIANDRRRTTLRKERNERRERIGWQQDPVYSLMNIISALPCSPEYEIRLQI